MSKSFYILCFMFFVTYKLSANLKLPAFFCDNMVLQQNSSVKIWGWAKNTETIKLQTSWDNQIYQDTADLNGNWLIEIKTPSYGGPYVMNIEGYDKINIKNIMIGEVWLVSGQSNMEWSINNKINNGDVEALKAQYPNIRMFNTFSKTSVVPEDDVYGNWEICNPTNVRNFSAVGYFFARKINQTLDVPIGIINSTWGGTPAEVWTPDDAITSDPILLKNALEKPESKWGPSEIGLLYNSMIAPLTRYKIKGCLWYQGESNTDYADTYDRLLSSMVTSWRKAWTYDFPFYFVQIAPYIYYESDHGARLRMAQSRAAKLIPKSEMVVISDIGDIKDIHPGNKQDVGLRLANIALAKDYNISIPHLHGPVLEKTEINNNIIKLYYESSGSLKCTASCLDAFEIADASRQYVKAKVSINKNIITLEADGIRFPILARFNGCNSCDALLTDDSNLPASVFLME